MEIKENQAAGYYRKEIYEAVQGAIGRILNPNEHTHLRNLLKAYVRAETGKDGKVVVEQAPKVHTFVCAKCDGSISGKGVAFYKQRRHRIVKEKDGKTLSNTEDPKDS